MNVFDCDNICVLFPGWGEAPSLPAERVVGPAVRRRRGLGGLPAGGLRPVAPGRGCAAVPPRAPRVSAPRAAPLYHPAPRVRDRLVREVISRHVPCDAPHQHHQQQQQQQHQHQHPGLALLASLRIPDKWIHLAQAHRAKYENKPLCEAQHLIAAQQWNAAHRVLLDELLPDAVLADDVKNILPLLSALSEAASRNEVSGWCGGGMALHCWTQAKEQILEISSSNERGEASAGLEALLPLIMAAFRALAHWKPTCSRQSAAHAELGGRLAQLGSAAGLRPARLAAALLPARLPPAAAAAALRQVGGRPASYRWPPGAAGQRCGAAAGAPGGRAAAGAAAARRRRGRPASGGRLAQLGSAAGLRPARLAAALLPARLPPAAAAAALRQ
ncbi:hypothetical protein ACJJTC_004128, partial [Scirpophaga incertulas]